MVNKDMIVAKILNEMIEIRVIEHKTSQDGKYIDFKYNNHQTLNAIINKCKNLTLRDWNDWGILRDEMYASVYEVMLKMSDNYTVDELLLILSDIHTKKLTITNQFLTGVYKLSVFKVKCNLSGNRRDGKKGMIDAFTNVEWNENNLQHMLEVSEDFDDKDLDIVFFIEWFNHNKHKFLTKKQLEFLEDPNITKTNKSTYRRRILERTMEFWKQTFDNIDNERVNELKTQIRTIEELLDNPNFDTLIHTSMNKHGYILDAIVTWVDLKTMREFNMGNRDYETVIKPYRVALFKKLNELNTALDKIMKKEGLDFIK